MYVGAEIDNTVDGASSYTPFFESIQAILIHSLRKELVLEEFVTQKTQRGHSYVTGVVNRPYKQPKKEDENENSKT